MHGLRKLLFPFSLIYGTVLRVRHFLYDTGVISSYKPSQKTIVVGNLSLGGTGKTPMVDYLVGLLGTEDVAVLSRGYGRESKGTLLVEARMSSKDSGDEPLLLKRKHQDLLVLVDEDRARGLKFLEKEHPEIMTVILDDAMQHRKVQADFYLLLTTWGNPFTEDQLLPAGDLRDIKSRGKTAQAVVVTKTPDDAEAMDKRELASKISYWGQEVYFSKVSYGDICDLQTDNPVNLSVTKVALVTGIADPSGFEIEVQKQFDVLKHFKFKDHHSFGQSDLIKLRNFIDTFGAEKPVVLTTEKDAQRLIAAKPFFAESEMEVYYWKIQTDFGGDTTRFNSMIRSI